MCCFDFLHHLRRWPAPGGDGRRQYEYGLDRSLLGILAGEQKAEDGNILQYRDSSHYSELFVLSEPADYQALALPDAVALVGDLLLRYDRHLLDAFRGVL